MENFWSKVDKNKSNVFYNGTRCWEWIPNKNERYGDFRYKGIKEKSHRVSYILTYGEFDRSLWVCHHCDNTKCVNPEHLFLGTQQDNTNDKVRKNRQSHSHTSINVGEDSWCSKLTDEKVIKIREIYSTGKYFQWEIAKIFNVDKSSISNAISGKTWKHIK